MARTMFVNDLMSRPVVSVDMNGTVLLACRRMRKHKVGSIIVTRRRKPVGIATETDMVRNIIALGRDPGTTAMKEIMSKQIISISRDAELKKAIEMMRAQRIKKLAVVERGKLVGILTVRDIGWSNYKDASDLYFG